MAHPLLDCRGRVPRVDGALGEAERRRQRWEPGRGDLAQPGQRRVGAEAGAEGGHGGGAAEEAVRKQTAHGGQGASPAVATASSSSARVPGSRAARQSGSRLKVVWLSDSTSARSACPAVSCGRRSRARSGSKKR